MAKDSWVKNTELGFINNIDSCQLVCSTEKLNPNNTNNKVKNEVKKEETKLISADEIAASYISNQKNSTILTESRLINPSQMMGEFGHFAISHGKKKKTLDRFHKVVFEDNKDPKNIETLLSIADDVGLDRKKLEKHLLEIGE
jgi:predicted DsbA family dithiol-disulfide isomerase